MASGYSIVKASAAAPTLIATVLASPVSPAAPADFSGPEVSPDGTKLAYIKNSAAPTTSLEVRDLATGSTTVLAAETSNDLTEFKLSEPTWSPDGNTIAYVDNASTFGAPDPTVKVVAATGGTPRSVERPAVAAAWRPDGTLTVARLDQTRNTTSLWITGATPTDAVLIPGSAGAGDHAWSPDGTQVAFSKFLSGNDGSVLPPLGPASIATLPAAGGTATVIVPGANSCNMTPAWSSDGQRVYFTKIGDGVCGTYAPSEIRRVPRTGGAVSTVVTGGYNFSLSVTTKAAAPVPSRSHDFNGDGYADVIGRTSTGDLRLYFGNGTGLSGYRVIGVGWGGMTAVFTPGDFNGDGHPDVIGRTSAGDLRLYFGTGSTLSGSARIGIG
ncbi:MAG: FG-GAP-like repeat-containing protein, partial [Pseudonocardiales bacterium]